MVSDESPKGSATRRASSTNRGAALKEPVYLASQLASICDVDLKTIHNWCDRNELPDEPAELESFRTPGGHLRFRHTAVLRFLTRWGYPIPDALLQDRPHVLLVEADPRARAALIHHLGLLRPGEEAGENGARRTAHDVADANLGLWASPLYYVHLWDDPYSALISLGERTGAGAPPDLAVLSLPLAGLDERAWIRAARERVEEGLHFVLILGDDGPRAAAREPDVVGIVARARLEDLRVVLEQQSALLASAAQRSAGGRPPRRRRVPIAPREPIFVASQVASIWDIDLKTVHNWVERGDIEAFRTPGRHLRFRRRSLLHFLRRYHMHIPGDLAPARPNVMVVSSDAAIHDALSARLSDEFDLLHHHDVVAALTEIGLRSSGAGLLDAIVVALPVEGVDDQRWVRAVSHHADTRYSRLVVIGGTEDDQLAWQGLGTTATVNHNQLDLLRTVLEKSLGLGA